MNSGVSISRGFRPVDVDVHRNQSKVELLFDPFLKSARESGRFCSSLGALARQSAGPDELSVGELPHPVSTPKPSNTVVPSAANRTTLCFLRSAATCLHQ